MFIGAAKITHCELFKDKDCWIDLTWNSFVSSCLSSGFSPAQPLWFSIPFGKWNTSKCENEGSESERGRNISNGDQVVPVVSESEPGRDISNGDQVVSVVSESEQGRNISNGD